MKRKGNDGLTKIASTKLEGSLKVLFNDVERSDFSSCELHPLPSRHIANQSFAIQ